MTYFAVSQDHAHLSAVNLSSVDICVETLCDSGFVLEHVMSEMYYYLVTLDLMTDRKHWLLLIVLLHFLSSNLFKRSLRVHCFNIKIHKIGIQ